MDNRQLMARTAIHSRSRYLILLCGVRALVLLVLTLSMLIGQFWLNLALFWPGLWAGVCAFGILLVASFHRANQPNALGNQAYLLNLIIEVAIFSFLLFQTGGASNPFVFYFLVPVSIAAATLPSLYAWVLAATCAVVYSLLLVIYRPLELFAMQHSMGPIWQNPHVLGMWLNFILSTFLITYFVSRLAGQVRARERELAEQQQRQREDENLLALGAFAAGTAHELATPLSTVGMLIDEARSSLDGNSAAAGDLETAAQQVERCNASLRRLAETARLASESESRPIQASLWLQRVCDQATNLYAGDIDLQLDLNPQAAESKIATDAALEQGVLNLLINAVQASKSRNSDQVELKLALDGEFVDLTLMDLGPGLDDELLDQLGRSFVSKREGGLGVGFYLANAAINRAGGTLSIRNRESGGALTHLRLPRVPSL